MNDVLARASGRSPTAGMLALAQAIAGNGTPPPLGQSRVPASVYTDPAYFAREKAAIFERM